MRIVSEGKAVGCVVSRQVHAALKARAAAGGISVAQSLAALIGAALEPASGRASEAMPVEPLADADLQRQLDARADTIQLLEQELAEAKADLAHANHLMEPLIEARDQWRARESETQEALQALGEQYGVMGGEPRIDGIKRVLAEQQAALKRRDSDIAALRARLAEMQAAAPREAASAETVSSDTATEAADYDLRRIAGAYRSAGWSIPAIAREMQRDVAAVRRALGGK